MVKEEEVGAIVLVRQVPIHPGVDDGGTSRDVVLVGLRGHQRQAEEGGGGRAAPRGQWQQRQWLQRKGVERGREEGDEVC
jgi:hypothetical protein